MFYLGNGSAQVYDGRELASLEDLRSSWGTDGQEVMAREEAVWVDEGQRS